MMLVVQCRKCSRTVRFWARDLALVLDPDHDAHLAPFPCSRCRTKANLDIQWIVPNAAELQTGLTVRRPVKQVVRWIWRDERT